MIDKKLDFKKKKKMCLKITCRQAKHLTANLTHVQKRLQSLSLAKMN